MMTLGLPQPRRGGVPWFTILLVLLLAFALGWVLRQGGLLPAPLPAPDDAPEAPRRPPPPPPSPESLRPRELPGGGLELRLSEDQINGMLGELSTRHQEQLEDIEVDLQPGRLVITAQGRQGPLRVPVRVVLEPYVQEGEVALRVLEASLGSVRVAPGVTDLLARRAEELLAREQKRHGLPAVQKVQITPRELILTGRRDAGRN